MNVRDARNSEEAWILETLQEQNADDHSFRSRDFVIVESDSGNARLAIGRLRRHTFRDKEVCEVTSLTLTENADSPVAFYMALSELASRAQQQGYEYVFSFCKDDDLFSNCGFEKTPAKHMTDQLSQRLNLKEKDLGVPLTPVSVETTEFETPLEEKTQEAREKKVRKDEIQQLSEELPVNTDRDESEYKYST